MPLHLLGKKSWNVYNPANIARVKADEAAAAAREAAEEQRMQEHDAEHRAAILRGQTPPPLLEEDAKNIGSQDRRPNKDRDGHDRKRRRLAGEDDTDRDMRLAKSMTDRGEDDNIAVLKLRKPKSDAPLTDHAGNINLFPIDVKEAVKREKNEEAEKEKQKKEQDLADQYTMRLSNAAGKGGLEQQPWYTSKSKVNHDAREDRDSEYPELENKDVWGREDPKRKEREKARVTSNDPLAFMNKAQIQLKKSKEDRRKWAEERNRELKGLRVAEEREYKRSSHSKRKHRTEADDLESFSLDDRRQDKGRHSQHKHRHRIRSRSRSHERRQSHKSSHRHDPKYEHRNGREREHRHQQDSSHRRHRSPDYGMEKK